jgi:GDP-4-dehydro-6-deoxy-D-mannose reductase
MKAVVTGASGFVGRHLVPLLRSRGWTVLTADRRGPADVVGDLDRVPLRRLRADVLFHLAAFSNPAESRNQAGETYAANAEVTARLAREARVGRLVLASTCAVYGEGRDLGESSPLLPRTPYAASKSCAESLALAGKRDTVILRPFNHTGPGQTEAYVCPRIARQVALAEAGKAAPRIRVADRAPERDFFDVRDMAEAYLAAALKGAPGGIYNVCTGRPVSIGRVASILAGLSRTKIRIEGPERDRSVLSGAPASFEAATGWRPQIPLERTLGDLLDHERALVRR